MDWTFERLAAHRDETFVFGTEGGTEVPLVLAAADPDGEGGGSLTFTGSSEQPMSQGTYPVRHEGADPLGEGLLFVVPIGQDDTVRTYQAVFG